MSARHPKETMMARVNRLPGGLWRGRGPVLPALESLEARLAPAVAIGAYIVTDASDANVGNVAQRTGTLRFCIDQANQNPGPDVIFFATSGPIGITSELQITDPLQIVGPSSSSRVQIERDPRAGYFRLFDITGSSPVGLSNLDLSGGDVSSGPYPGSGGAIAYSGALSLSNCTIHNNAAVTGGAIFGSNGSINIDHCVIENNTSQFRGGGLDLYSSAVSLTNSLIKGNVATDYNSAAGGLYTFSAGSVSIQNTTFQANQAGFGGGMLAETFQVNSTVDLTNSTFGGNNAYINGGAIGTTANAGTVTIDLGNCTVANNTSNGPAGGAYAYSLSGGYAHLSYQNTIFSNNGSSNLWAYNGYGPYKLESLGHNLSTDASGNFTAPGDLTYTDAALGPLGDNGGPTPTFSLQPASPAIDNGIAVQGVSSDQRGTARPQFGAPDIGAVESTVPYNAIPVISGFNLSPNPVVVGSPFTLSGTIVDPPSNEPHTVSITWGDGATTTLDLAAGVTAFSATHTYRFLPASEGDFEGNSFGVVVAVNDTIQGSALFAFVQVSLAPVSLSIDTTDEFVDANQLFLRSGQVTGGDGNYALSVDYGDGTGVQPLAYNADGNFVLSHVYASEGTFDVHIHAVGETGEDAKTFQVDVLLPGVPTDNADKQFVPAGQTGTASAPGVTVTLVHSSGGRAAAVIVAVVPTFVADGLNGSTQVGDNTITSAYDVRAINVGPSDVAYVTFHYNTSNFELPTLTYFDRRTGQQKAVDSRLYIVDRFNHTVTLVLDGNSTPRLQDLRGTVFTIAVPLTVSAPSDSSTLSILERIGVPLEELRGSSGSIAGVLAQATAPFTGGTAFFTIGVLDAGGGGGGPDDGGTNPLAKSLVELPEVPGALITLPGPILTPGSAELPLGPEPEPTPTADPAGVARTASGQNAEAKTADSGSTEEAHQTASPSPGKQGAAKKMEPQDEVFLDLGDDLLHPGLAAWQEPPAAWRDLSLAAAATLAAQAAGGRSGDEGQSRDGRPKRVDRGRAERVPR